MQLNDGLPSQSGERFVHERFGAQFYSTMAPMHVMGASFPTTLMRGRRRGGVVALELLAYGTAGSKRELRRARFALSVDGSTCVHEGLFAVEQ
jgi:hypothetical protein